MMTSLTDKMTSLECIRNETYVSGLAATDSSLCACSTSTGPNSWPRGAAYDATSSSSVPQLHLQSNKDTSNHGPIVREEEGQPPLKVTADVNPGMDVKDYSKASDGVKYIYEPHFHNQAPLAPATNYQLGGMGGVKDRTSPSTSLCWEEPTHLSYLPKAHSSRRAFSGHVLLTNPPSGPHRHLTPASRTTSKKAGGGNNGTKEDENNKHGKHPEENTDCKGNEGSRGGKGEVDGVALPRMATGSGPTSSSCGQLATALPAPSSLTARADTETAVPSKFTTTGAQYPKQSQQHRQTGAASTSEEAFCQPTRDLSVRLVALYKYINARYWQQRRAEASGPKYNNGYDDKDGHYIVLPGEEILNRFTVQEVLGKGSFGTVIRCYDEKRHEAVALKITRHGFNFREQAKLELDILLKLNENANLNHLVVKLLKVFDWQGHLVLMFELLSFNLYQLIKCTRYKGVCLDLVCKFAYQLVCTLRQLEQQKPHPIIHCDLKPENILLKSQNRSGIRLIDFGSACYTDWRIHRYIQSRFYRSPEVILHLDYSTAIDRWSLGCVLVELHTGVPLFCGHSEAEQLGCFEAVLGPLPQDMLASSSKATKYYTLSPEGTYRLKEPAPARRSLESVLARGTDASSEQRREGHAQDEGLCHAFLDFIRQLLRYHPQERISCVDALQHPFFASLLNSKRGPPAVLGEGA